MTVGPGGTEDPSTLPQPLRSGIIVLRVKHRYVMPIFTPLLWGICLVPATAGVMDQLDRIKNVICFSMKLTERIRTESQMKMHIPQPWRWGQPQMKKHTPQSWHWGQSQVNKHTPQSWWWRWSERHVFGSLLPMKKESVRSLAGNWTWTAPCPPAPDSKAQPPSCHCPFPPYVSEATRQRWLNLDVPFSLMKYHLFRESLRICCKYSSRQPCPGTGTFLGPLELLNKCFKNPPSCFLYPPGPCFEDSFPH